MKVAIDARPLVSGDSVRGIGVYTRELVDAFKKGNKKFSVLDNDFNSKEFSKFDLIHFTSFNPYIISVPFTKPKNTKFILTIYDLIPLIYPAHYPSGIRGGIRWTLNKYFIKKNVDAILTISETSKKDICRFLGIDPKKVFVTHLAPRDMFKKITNTTILYSIVVKYNLPKKFALYVGDINYNKNIPNLIKACQLCGTPLVIVGKQAKDIEQLTQQVPNGPQDVARKIFGRSHPQLSHLENLRKLVDDRNVTRLGFVPDEELVDIYNLASVYCQASFAEGFGLPVLEAMACGTQVAISNTHSLSEIAGSAAEYFDPNNVSDISKALQKAIDNKFNVAAQAKKFSWEKTATQTLEAYRDILGS